MTRSIHKRIAAFMGVAAVAATGTVALGYFTGGGSGTGTASVGSSAPGVSISATTSGELFPGGGPATVSVHVKNTSASLSAHVGTVTLTKITPDEAHSGCVTSLTGSPPAFEMAAISVEKTLKPSEEAEVKGALQMNDTGVSQNACQGAKLTLSFSSS